MPPARVLLSVVLTQHCPVSSRNSTLNVRLKRGDEEESRNNNNNNKTKVDRRPSKGLFACRNFQGEKREDFVHYSFQIQISFVIQTQESKATHTFQLNLLLSKVLLLGLSENQDQTDLYDSISHCISLLFNLRN